MATFKYKGKYGGFVEIQSDLFEDVKFVEKERYLQLDQTVIDETNGVPADVEVNIYVKLKNKAIITNCKSVVKSRTLKFTEKDNVIYSDITRIITKNYNSNDKKEEYSDIYDPDYDDSSTTQFPKNSALEYFSIDNGCCKNFYHNENTLSPERYNYFKDGYVFMIENIVVKDNKFRSYYDESSNIQYVYYTDNGSTSYETTLTFTGEFFTNTEIIVENSKYNALTYIYGLYYYQDDYNNLNEEDKLLIYVYSYYDTNDILIDNIILFDDILYCHNYSKRNDNNGDTGNYNTYICLDCNNCKSDQEIKSNIDVLYSGSILANDYTSKVRGPSGLFTNIYENTKYLWTKKICKKSDYFSDNQDLGASNFYNFKIFIHTIFNTKFDIITALTPVLEDDNFLEYNSLHIISQPLNNTITMDNENQFSFLNKHMLMNNTSEYSSSSNKNVFSSKIRNMFDVRTLNENYLWLNSNNLYDLAILDVLNDNVGIHEFLECVPYYVNTKSIIITSDINVSRTNIISNFINLCDSFDGNIFDEEFTIDVLLENNLTSSIRSTLTHFKTDEDGGIRFHYPSEFILTELSSSSLGTLGGRYYNIDKIPETNYDIYLNLCKNIEWNSFPTNIKVKDLVKNNNTIINLDVYNNRISKTYKILFYEDCIRTIGIVPAYNETLDNVFNLSNNKKMISYLMTIDNINSNHDKVATYTLVDLSPLPFFSKFLYFFKTFPAHLTYFISYTHGGINFNKKFEYILFSSTAKKRIRDKTLIKILNIISKNVIVFSYSCFGGGHLKVGLNGFTDVLPHNEIGCKNNIIFFYSDTASSETIINAYNRYVSLQFRKILANSNDKLIDIIDMHNLKQLCILKEKDQLLLKLYYNIKQFVEKHKYKYLELNRSTKFLDEIKRNIIPINIKTTHGNIFRCSSEYFKIFMENNKLNINCSLLTFMRCLVTAFAFNENDIGLYNNYLILLQRIINSKIFDANNFNNYNTLYEFIECVKKYKYNLSEEFLFYLRRIVYWSLFGVEYVDYNNEYNNEYNNNTLKFLEECIYEFYYELVKLLRRIFSDNTICYDNFPNSNPRSYTVHDYPGVSFLIKDKNVLNNTFFDLAYA